MEPKRGRVDRSRVKHVHQHELDTAARLSRIGFNVTFMPATSTPAADVLLNGVPWELKSPTGSTRDTIMRNVRYATRQADRLVLDLARTAIDDDVAGAAATQALRRYTRVDEILLLRKDGTAQRIRR